MKQNVSCGSRNDTAVRRLDLLGFPIVIAKFCTVDDFSLIE
jgi:hypothetical protein